MSVIEVPNGEAPTYPQTYRVEVIQGEPGVAGQALNAIASEGWRFIQAIPAMGAPNRFQQQQVPVLICIFEART